MTKGVEPSGVFVFSDSPKNLPGFAITGRELAEALGTRLTAVFPRAGDDQRESAARNLFDAVVRIDGDFSALFMPEACVAALLEVARRFRPRVILFDSSRSGREICARVGQRLGVAAATGCMRVWAQDGDVAIERPCYGGRFTAVQRISSVPCLISLSVGKTEPPPLAGVAELVDFPVPWNPTSVQVLSSAAKAAETTLETAERVVAVGRGLRRNEDLQLIYSLAEVLGAAVGGTRPLTEDLKWLPRDVQVGISGKTVKPKLYLACGLSGQIQHVAGMRESAVVVAVNIDEQAPICSEADYSVIGDLYQVVPALIQELSGRRGRQTGT